MRGVGVTAAACAAGAADMAVAAALGDVTGSGRGRSLSCKRGGSDRG